MVILKNKVSLFCLSLLITMLASTVQAQLLANGTYVIKNNHSGKVLDVSGGSTADGANIIQYSANGGDNQLWNVTHLGNEQYSIISVKSQKSIEVYNWDSADGANIVQWTYWGGETQKWTLNAIDNGTFGVVNSFSGKAMEVYNFSTENSANIAQWTYWQGAPQQWVFEAVEYSAPATPSATSFSDVSVHDPSFTKVTENGVDTYYIFGSHLAAAKSTDLMNWTWVAAGVDDYNPLFNYNVSNELAEGFAWTGEQGLWAADVIQLSDGKYYFYYNQSLMVAPRGYTGVATASNIEGPYANQELLLKSGMWGEESENAGEIYDPIIHPNAVDPDTFYDKNGKLWMIYGSYSGGIFILEMDDSTGKPIAGQGYGKHLLGGNHSNIEGAYVLYSPESDYYYMFTSFGGLASDGGYNMRISRSQSPDGPYYDAAGNDMANASGDRDSIDDYGVKLMGGFQFADEVGYLSPGHNSAYYDETTGKHFVIFHTRFPEQGEGHAVRVHEMFINSQGWLVASPHRYVNISGENKVDDSNVVGTYKFINHEKDINTTTKNSTTAYLNADHTVSGSVSGTWWIQEGNNIVLTLNNLDTFYGVAKWQWNTTSEKLVPVFTALSNNGVSIWGSKE